MPSYLVMKLKRALFLANVSLKQNDKSAIPNRDLLGSDDDGKTQQPSAKTKLNQPDFYLMELKKLLFILPLQTINKRKE